MVKVKGRPDERTLSTIRKGMSIGDGERLGDIQVNFVKFKETTTWVRVTLSEGKKNEIKRIFFRINHPVRKIRRIMFGPFSLGDLPTGQARLLNKTESVWLQELLAAEPEPRPKADRPRKRSPRESGRRQDEPGKPVHRPKNKV
jgi:16S rRNA U516 pseudouridylate synthase RsuA-like enzyme